MKKIPSLFVRDWEGDKSRVLNKVEPECEWALTEGVATRKWDGTACMVRGGRLFKRYDAKHGKPAPAGFEPAQEPDPKTGHWPGWIPIGPGDRWHQFVMGEALALPDGTYELCGPSVGGNPERFGTHVLVPHGVHHVPVEARTYGDFAAYLRLHAIEGIVFHHPDGRMCKVKAGDLGIPWPR